jgi:hypothetical protein
LIEVLSWGVKIGERSKMLAADVRRGLWPAVAEIFAAVPELMAIHV